MKKNIAIFFGGDSVEHDISVITALQAIKNINKGKYDIIPVYLKDSLWWSGENLLKMEYYSEGELKANKVVLLPDGYLYKQGIILKKYRHIDVALLCFHGHGGEDGCVQGLLELYGIPYTSAGVIGSAISCDKSLFKEVLKGLNVDCIESVSFNNNEYYANSKMWLYKVAKFGFPVVVKPSTLGSSIGISVCKNKKELMSALELAFNLDNRVLIEKYCQNMREINCAVAGYGDEIIVSELEEPVTKNEILSFENKYLNNQKQGMASASRKIPAEISKEDSKKIKEVALLLFQKLDLKGVVRFDFILSDGKIYLNELNSIPGSLAFYLFEPMGIKYTELLDKLILWALRDYENKSKITRKFKNNIFDKVSLDGIKK